MADSSQSEMPRKAIKKKKNHYTKQKQEEQEDEPSNITEEDAPWPEIKLQDMSITEKKRLTCFFYYGGERRVLPCGTFHYVGGVSEAMMIEDDMTKGELLSRIGSRLNISLHNKLIFHNTKRDKIKYLRVKDDNGVKMMFYLNEDEVDVFVDVDPFDTSTRELNIVKSNKAPREKKRLTCICYWDGLRMVQPNGTFKYVNGVSGAVPIEDGMSYNELLSKICSCLNISKHGKLFFYNSKRDKTKYLRVKDGNGVQMLFQMNEEEVDVFVEEDPNHFRFGRTSQLNIRVVCAASSAAGSSSSEGNFNPYEVLGVSPIAGFEVVNEAYARKHKDAQERKDEATAAQLEEAHDKLLMAELEN